MMSSWSDDLAIEIEALQATYGTDLILNEPHQQVSMLVLPQQHAVQQQQQQHYVQCLLLFTLPADYPSQAPAIHIQDAKGFISRQGQLQQQLTADAAELAGELLLGHLFEAAKAWLTDNDVPEGPCIFCLDDLAVTSGSSNSSSNAAGCQRNQQQKTLRLPCFHVYHRGCFDDWWCWQQQAYMEQQKALEARTGATAAAALVQESLPPKDGPLFQLSCPTCRAPFQLRDLPAFIQQQLQQRLEQQQQQSQGSHQKQHAHTEKLTPAQLQPFLEMQQQHAKLFAAQQQWQGIIDSEASYCIADWEGPSSSAAEPAGPRGAAAVSAAIGDSSASAARCATAAAGTGPSRGRGTGRSVTGPHDKGSSSSRSIRDRGRGRGRSRGQREHLSDDLSRLDVSQQQRQQQQQQQLGQEASGERQRQQQQQQQQQNHNTHSQRQQQQQRQPSPASGDSCASQQHVAQQQPRSQAAPAQQQPQQRHGAPLHTSVSGSGRQVSQYAGMQHEPSRGRTLPGMEPAPADVQAGRHSMHRGGGGSSRGRGSRRSRGRGRVAESEPMAGN